MIKVLRNYSSNVRRSKHNLLQSGYDVHVIANGVKKSREGLKNPPEAHEALKYNFYIKHSSVLHPKPMKATSYLGGVVDVHGRFIGSWHGGDIR